MLIKLKQAFPFLDLINLINPSLGAQNLKTEAVDYRSFSEGEVYEHYGDKAKNLIVISDQELINQPLISTYVFSCDLDMAKNDALYFEYAKRRIQSKKDDQIYPNLTEADVKFLQNEPLFLKEFKTFLQNWNHSTFYSELSTRAVDLSRSAPTPEYPKGIPTLDSNIRKQNNEYMAKIDEEGSKLYVPLNDYMEYVSESHEHIAYMDWIEKRRAQSH